MLRLLDPAEWSRRATRWHMWQIGMCAAACGTLVAGLAVAFALYLTAASRLAGFRLEGRSLLPSAADLVAAWFEWHADRWIGPAEWIFLGTLLAVATSLVGSTWLLLPFVHRGGDLRRSYFRCFSGLLAALAALSVALVASFVLFAAVPWPLYWSPGWLWMASPLPVVVVLLAAALGALVIERAVAGAQDEAFAADLPPRCEGCGYDLTSRAPDERCPECGLGVTASLASERRPGVAFAQRPGFVGFARTSAALLVRPRRFHGALRLRASASEPLPPLVVARRFARRHWMLLWSAALLWVVLLMSAVQQIYGSGEQLFLYLCQMAASGLALLAVSVGGALGMPAVLLCGVIGVWFWITSEGWTAGPEGTVIVFAAPPLAATAVTLCAWGLHRGLAALVFTVWAAWRVLPDFRWAAVAIQYETTFLWWFALALGALLASFVVGNDWISGLIGRDVFMRAFRMPPEPIAVAFAIVALAAGWLFRYAIALRAIRWSNH